MSKHIARIARSARFADTWVFAAALLFLALFAFSEVWVHLEADRFPKSALFRLFLLCLICALAYLGGLLFVERTGNRRCLTVLMGIFFLLYLYMLLNFTLLDKGMGRNTLLSDAGEDAREYYLRRFVNLRPGRSIYEVYILGFVHGYVNAYYMLLNLLGNVCAFMPFAFFLPMFWRAMRHWYFFLPAMILAVASVEALQFAFMVGSCDVDDVILNVSGAMLLFFLFQIPPLSRFVQRVSGRADLQTL